MRRWLIRIALVLVVAFVLIQAVPYGWRHSNPEVVADAPWPDAASASLARGACYDCHSNETRWPAYSYVAPMSWLIRSDVDEGRDAMNLSLWGTDGVGEVDDAAEEIEGGEMPPRKYELLHPDARLSDDERAQLIAAFQSLGDGEGDDGGGDDSSGHGNGGDDDDDSSGRGSGGDDDD